MCDTVCWGVGSLLLWSDYCLCLCCVCVTVRLVLGGVSVVETETGAGVSAVMIPCLQGERMVLVAQYCSHVLCVAVWL